VIATNLDGSIVVSNTQAVDIQRDPLPLMVSCPIVAEPNIPYKCGFASIPGSGSLGVWYDEDTNGLTANYSFVPFGNSYSSF
jgi:hypothetical protein